MMDQDPEDHGEWIEKEKKKAEEGKIRKLRHYQEEKRRNRLKKWHYRRLPLEAVVDVVH
jgi:hypothetical protein